MRIFLALLLSLFCLWPGSSQAFSESNCQIYWKAYLLPDSGRQAGQADSGPGAAVRKLLLALTVVPPEGRYLYGPASDVGLPTSLEVRYSRLDAFPMQALKPKEIAALLDEKGSKARLRLPSPSPKKETVHASMALSGIDDSDALIYPGSVTFWAELPAPAFGLGGVAVHVDMSGLLCSPSSCMPASGQASFALSAGDVRTLPGAETEVWWQDWKQGENVFIQPPDVFLALNAVKEEPSPFAAGRSLRKAEEPKQSPAVLDPTESLVRQTAFFSTFDPTPFNPSMEVRHLWEALLFGLAAGLLLNLMPCVLPVVSLKFSALMAVSTMVDKRRQAQAFRRHCLIFAMGIMTWFIVLALLLGVAGWAWGEIFQLPGVIVVLAIVLFLLGLSLFGVYTLPLFDLKLSQNNHPNWQAFGSGLLATLLATPCSGPLLGGVLAWAIRQDLPVLVLTISSIGLGMCVPYCILAIWPRLVHLLPRPGAWTLRLEQLLGFFLMGSVVYLTTLLPPEWIPPFLFNLFAVALAAWLWGQIGHLGASRLRRGLSRGLALVVVLLATWWGAGAIQAETSWEPFDADKFIQLVGKEPMLLDFTADWCPSCKALEHTTLSEKRITALRQKYKIRTIKVDLTRDAEAGKELLRALNSTSIPVIALFPSGEESRNPVVLRDLVTPKQLDEAAASVF